MGGGVIEERRLAVRYARCSAGSCEARVLALVSVLLMLASRTLPVAAQEADAPTIDDRLVEPLHALDELADRDGQPYSDLIQGSNLQLLLATLPLRPACSSTTCGPAQLPSTDRLLGEDRQRRRDGRRSRAPQHVRDKDAMARGEAHYDCLDFSRVPRGVRGAGAVCERLTELPARTPIERELSGAARIYDRQGTEGLREAVARVPFYQQACPV